ncbi:MAG TPA: YqgE/AlgH family protein [Psychromonas hadalis]|nr:YqgE/AlgH family protein [Psychromonas hadalis]
MPNTQVLTTLKNQFLIAMPTLTDPYFKKSVVYLCEHDDQGAMGFIINYPVKLTVQELLQNIDSIEHQPEPPLLNNVFLGGPLELEHGFILHSPLSDQTLNDRSKLLNDQLMMSNANSVLTSLGTANEPDKYMVTLGYASWDAGQLESEMLENHWLTVDFEDELLFETPIEDRWQASLNRLGVDPEKLSTLIGNV